MATKIKMVKVNDPNHAYFEHIKYSIVSPVHYSLVFQEGFKNIEMKEYENEGNENLPHLPFLDISRKILIYCCLAEQFLYKEGAKITGIEEEIKASFSFVRKCFAKLDDVEWREFCKSLIKLAQTLDYLAINPVDIYEKPCAGLFAFFNKMERKIAYSDKEYTSLKHICREIGLVVDEVEFETDAIYSWDSAMHETLHTLNCFIKYYQNLFHEINEERETDSYKAVERLSNVIYTEKLDENTGLIYNVKHFSYATLNLACKEKTGLNFDEFKKLCKDMAIFGDAIIINTESSFKHIKKAILFMMQAYGDSIKMVWVDTKDGSYGECVKAKNMLSGYLMLEERDEVVSKRVYDALY